MSAGNLRHRDRDRESSRPTTPISREEAARQAAEANNARAQGARLTHAPSSPATDSPRIAAACAQDRADLASLAPVFQIAESERHPDPEEALATLRQRMRESIEAERAGEGITVAARGGAVSISRWTVLRDRLTSTDALWKVFARYGFYALLAAGILAALFGMFEFFRPLAPASSPAAAAGAAWLFFPGF